MNDSIRRAKFDWIAKATESVLFLIGTICLMELISIGQNAGLDYFEFIRAFFGLTKFFANNEIQVIVLKIVLVLLFVPKGIKLVVFALRRAIPKYKEMLL